MVADVNSLIKAVEHEEHVEDCLDCTVSDALSSIWHDAKNQGTYALQRVVQFRTEILDGLDHR